MDTDQPSVATVTVTALFGFTGTVDLTDTPPTGLSCSPLNPSSMTLNSYAGPGTANLSCNASVPGLYNVTVTGMSGSLTRTASYTGNFTAAGPSNPEPTRIFGLSLTVFYATVGVFTAVAAAVAYFGLRRGKPRARQRA